MTSSNLFQKIEYLLACNKLVFLRSCFSEWQKDFVKSFAANRTVVDLSEPLVRERATLHTQEFLRNLAKPVLFYNVEYVPQICDYLLADDVPNGSYLAVVGFDYNILEETCVELPLQDVDRLAVMPAAYFLVKLLALQNDEQDVFSPRSGENVLRKIIQGGLSTNVFAAADAKNAFFLNYVRDFIQRKVKDLTTVSDDMRFYRFLCAVAANSGSMVNYANLGKAADISSPTAKQWMSYLLALGVVYFLEPITSCNLKRVNKAAKLYFRDTGLAAYLLRIPNEEALAESAFFSSLFETYVVNAIRESYLASGEAVQLAYFRDSNAKEISLLLEREGVLYPIEIKKDKLSIAKLTKKFKFLRAVENERLKIGNGCVITLEKNVKQLAEALWQVPARIL